MELIVGNKYKINGSNATGWYEVREVRTNATGAQEVICQGQEPFTRIFTPEQFVKEKDKKSQAKKIISEVQEVVAVWGDVELNIENVSYWPEWGARGRPRKSK